MASSHITQGSTEASVRVAPDLLDEFRVVQYVEVVVDEDRMMKWFAFEHLPVSLKDTSRMFHSLASDICADIAAGPERTVALRKLLEAKDAAVRAKLNPGG